MRKDIDFSASVEASGLIEKNSLTDNTLSEADIFLSVKLSFHNTFVCRKKILFNYKITYMSFKSQNANFDLYPKKLPLEINSVLCYAVYVYYALRRRNMKASKKKIAIIGSSNSVHSLYNSGEHTDIVCGISL